MGDRFFDMPKEDEFFRPLFSKKWERNLNKMMQDESFNGIDNGETYKTSTVYSNNNGVESKKTVSTKRVIKNGVAETHTTEEYEFPNGTKEVRRIKDDGRGTVTSNVYNLKKGETLPIEN